MGDETVTAGAGTERVLTNMANEFDKRGYHVIVATNDEKNAIAYFPFSEQVETIYLNLENIKMPFYVKVKREINRIVSAWDKPFEAYRASLSASRLKRCLLKKHVDCIVAYNHESVQVADKMQLHIPLAYMMHNSVKILMGNANRITLLEKEKADVIQVLMPSYVQEAKRYLHHTPVIWIPNVVYPVAKDRQAQLGVEKKNYTIITVGRLEKNQKRTHLLIQAFGKLASHYPQWHVEVWGDLKKHNPYYQQVIKMISDLHLEGRVLLGGPTQYVQEKLQNADIFAFPSAYEGFPLALTEAMATGLPSVGFQSADAVNELIVDGANGILCDDSIDAYAKGLELLMQNQQLRVQMGKKAVELMKPYSPQVVWDKWQKVIENLIHHCEIKGD